MTSLETNRCITHVPLTWHNPCQERFCAHIYENHEVTEVDSLVDVVGNGHELRRLQVLYDAAASCMAGIQGGATRTPQSACKVPVIMFLGEILSKYSMIKRHAI